MFPKKCCLYIELKLGTTILAIVESVFFAYLTFQCLVYTFTYKDEPFDYLGFASCMLIMAGFSLITVLTNVLLIFGIYKKKSTSHHLIWQWFWVSICGISLTFVASTVAYWVHRHLVHNHNLDVLLWAFLAICVYHTYFGACVCGILRDIRKEKHRFISRMEVS